MALDVGFQEEEATGWTGDRLGAGCCSGGADLSAGLGPPITTSNEPSANLTAEGVKPADSMVRIARLTSVGRNGHGDLDMRLLPRLESGADQPRSTRQFVGSHPAARNGCS